MFKISVIQKALYDWVVSQVSPTPVIWLNPNAPSPNSEYISLNISGFTSSAFDYQTPPDNLGFASLYGNREFSLDLSFYGDKNTQGLNGFDYIEKLQTSLQEINVQAALFQQGVIFVRRLSITNTTEVFDTRYQERIILELMFRVSNQGVDTPSKFEVGLIESTQIDGEVLNELNDAIDISILIDTN